MLRMLPLRCRERVPDAEPNAARVAVEEEQAR